MGLLIALAVVAALYYVVRKLVRAAYSRGFYACQRRYAGTD